MQTVARILLIDDDPDLARFLQEALAGHGHEVHWLERAEAGPQLLTAARPPFRLVLLDVNLPGMSGIEFLETLRARAIQVPVVLVTGDDTSDMFIRAHKLRAHDYVVKPEDYQSLAGKLLPIICDALAITEPQPKVPLLPEAPVQPSPGPSLVGRSDAMREVYRLIAQFAETDDAVLIRGETGTGKELVARALHTHGEGRRDKPFVALNCAAFPENLLETELFGHEKGAFTGADKLRKGKFECADGGTIFLDEIGDMPLMLQAKLLRVLQSQELERVGSNEPIRVNVRILSATHRDLEAAIAEGKFRQDLFYRLNGVTIRLPPLRERPDDVPKLAAHFLRRAAEEKGRTAPELAAATLDRLRAHHWPGNVRELENVIRCAFGFCRGPQLLPSHLPNLPRESGAADVAGGLNRLCQRAFESRPEKLWPLLHDLLEQELLRVALAKLDNNQTRVAERLGLSRNTVIDRMQKYGLR
jgi:DNA-binding NtrC family response regulator